MRISDDLVEQIQNFVPADVIRKYEEKIIDGQAIFRNATRHNIFLNLVFMYPETMVLRSDFTLLNPDTAIIMNMPEGMGIISIFAATALGDQHASHVYNIPLRNSIFVAYQHGDDMKTWHVWEKLKI